MSHTIDGAQRLNSGWPSELNNRRLPLHGLAWNGVLDVTTEREMCQDLFEQCRQLLRYDGIDKDRVRQAVDRIRDIVDERLALLENDELDDD